MTSKNENFLKNLSIVLFIFHLVIILLINFLTGNFEGVIGFLGAAAFTVGNQILVFISFFLLLYKKINKKGTYIFMSFQMLASIGIYCSNFINTSPALGIIIGILSNALYVTCMILLLYHNLKSFPRHISVRTSSNTLTNNSAIKFCRKCGNQLISGSKFCNKCGSKTDWIEE